MVDFSSARIRRTGRLKVDFPRFEQLLNCDEVQWVLYCLDWGKAQFTLGVKQKLGMLQTRVVLSDCTL